MQIQRKTLAQEVADRLIEGIVSNEYAVGEKLPTEPELMKIYGVGRSSIREAIKILSIKGVLDVQQGVGTFVISNTIHESLESQMDKAQIEDVQEVRSLLDAKIAAKAALYRDEEQLEKIKFYLNQRNALAEEKKALECYQADTNFHIAIAEACGNSLLKEIYKITSSHILRSFEIRHNDTSSFIISQAIHERLYLAIETQNAEEAAFIAQQIVDRIY
ncbi:FadR family transcriptional regulator [Chryseobacterium sp. Y16C]|uniref:FadR/GntR family transcriptional regulator n=1 Tax=Chryseobacterium sp. Y16C TaxID=2920939 RepID=UPI001F0A987B|nr:FadR/GntR family transcriptional regulator [Chryseobacterium sp. Y16C]UMQ40226.1 FadR family transcriptional regulator [Chryseobacterium sp. Y16C]